MIMLLKIVRMVFMTIMVDNNDGFILDLGANGGVWYDDRAL